jgi:hypothetical protein
LESKLDVLPSIDRSNGNAPESEAEGLLGIDGIHLKNTSEVGYVGYQQSLVLANGTKHASDLLATASSAADVPAGAFRSFEKHFWPLLVPLGHELQEFKGQRYAPKDTELFLLDEKATGQDSTQSRTSNTRGSGM